MERDRGKRMNPGKVDLQVERRDEGRECSRLKDSEIQRMYHHASKNGNECGTFSICISIVEVIVCILVL